MTYTLATDHGTVLWREDLFSTIEEAQEAQAAQPTTPDGSATIVVTTSQAHKLNAMWKELYAEIEHAKDIVSHARTAAILNNPSIPTILDV